MGPKEPRQYDKQDIADLTSYILYRLEHSSHGSLALTYPNNLQVPTNLTLEFYIKDSAQKSEQHFGTAAYTSKLAFKDGVSSLYFFDFSPGYAFNPSFKRKTLETRVNYASVNKRPSKEPRMPYQIRPELSKPKVSTTRVQYGWGKENIKRYKPKGNGMIQSKSHKAATETMKSIDSKAKKKRID